MRRIAEKQASLDKTESKISSLRGQIQIFQEALERYERERDQKAEALRKMQALVEAAGSASDMELEELNTKRVQTILDNKWVPGDPVETNLEKQPEFLKLVARIEEIRNVRENLDKEVNKIYYGKA